MNELLKPIAFDARTAAYILPKKILLKTDGTEKADRLLTDVVTQSSIGIGELTVLSTEGGKKALLLLDFGCEMFGGIRLITRECSKRDGVPLHVRFGESASEAMAPLGYKGACNDHAVRDTDILLPWNSDTVFGQTGFRFVCLELTDPASFIQLRAVQAVALYRDIPYLGQFSGGDALLDRIYAVSAYTVHLNMQSLLWDGIKRDRLVWIGDMHPELLTIRSVFGHQAVADDSLRHISRTSPMPGWPCRMTPYGLWFLLCLWEQYRYTGDEALVSELADYWQPLLREVLALVHDEKPLLREDEWQAGFFLDWPSKGSPEAEGGIYALTVLTLRAAAGLCALIGNEELKAACHAKCERLSAVHFPVGEKKQVTAFLQLAGLAEGDVAAALTAGGGHGMSTFMSYYILKATAETAGVAAALSMLREYYGGMLQAGATTFWEDFDLNWLRDGADISKLPQEDGYDIHGDNGRYCYQGFRHSLCHGWSGGPAAFLAETVLGVQILSPGCREVAIRPQLGDLKEVTGCYPTPQGVIRITARKENGKTVTEITAPKEISVLRE